MLRIPQGGEKSAPLTVALQKIGFAETEADPQGEKRTRTNRKKKQKEAETPNWDASAGAWRSTRKKGKRVFQTVVGWTVLVIAVSGGAIFIAKSFESKGDIAGGDPTPAVDQFENLVNVPLLQPDEESIEPIELPKVMRHSEAEFINLVQPLAEKFLAAKQIEAVLPFVSDSKNVWHKIRAHYPGGVVEPLGLSKFNSTGRVSYKDNFAAVSVTTRDFGSKQMAFIEDEDGLKIDWESWVGWSEMPWGEIVKTKPSNPVLVRAILKATDYYNFGFADEKKWRSYRLVSPDGETMLYGYVERNSLLDQRIRPGEQGLTVALTVRIHFPKGGIADNQVIIDEYVADGWVIAGGEK